MHDCRHTETSLWQHCLAELVQVKPWPLTSTNWSEHQWQSVFTGLELSEPRVPSVAWCFYLFLFFSFVTGGTKHSLVVNRMWVYITRGGLIKKIS